MSERKTVSFGEFLADIIGDTTVADLRAELSAALARCAVLETTLRRADEAIAGLISDFAHVSDEHIEARAEREPDNGYDDVIAGRAARAEIARVLKNG